MGRPGKGKAKAKAPSAAALAKAAANAVFVWAQCDNAGCQKWRKLPPGTKIDEHNPWCVQRCCTGPAGLLHPPLELAVRTQGPCGVLCAVQSPLLAVLLRLALSAG